LTLFYYVPMQELHSILHSLTSAEWHSFQNYLTCFSSHSPENIKQLQLAKLLMQAETCPEQDACRIIIYGTKEDICFDILKSALKEKTLDFLLTDISCDKKQELDEADYAIIKMKKKSAQFQQLYYSKKRNLLFYSLLDEIIFLSKEYEQYSLLVEHLRLKKALVSWKKGKEEFRKVSEQMKKYFLFNEIVNKAEHYYYELNMMNEYCGKQDVEMKQQFLKKAIIGLQDGYEQTKSALVNYHLKFLEIEYYQMQNNYSKGRSVCLEWLDVVRKNKSVYRRQRVGVVYDNLSRCEFYMGHYRQAREWAREAQKHFNAGSENYCIALEQEFYALFAMEQYGEAITIAEKMISSATRKELGEFRDAKYHYLLANALFKKERFREALNLLSTERSLSQDKAGWETGARTLKIMTLIEMNLWDEASLAVHSLKQFFHYTEKNGTPVSPRDKKILNLLLIAERKGFMFTLLNGSADKYMNALSPTPPNKVTESVILRTALPIREGEKKYKSSPSAGENISSPDGRGQEGAWQPFTHEVIPFHEWFAGKLRKRKLIERSASENPRT